MVIEINEKDLTDIKRKIKYLVKIKENLMKEQDVRLVQDDKLEKKLKGKEKDYQSILSLYESNISEIYDKKDHNCFYVYFHCDPNSPLNIGKNAKDLFAASIGLTHRPFYVGKGTGDRYNNTNRNDSYAKKKQQIKQSGKEIIIVKWKEELSEDISFIYESKFIDIFGLLSFNQHNWLVNLDEGKDKERRRSLYKKGSRRILLSNKMIVN
jgi:hypothetical protein